MKRRTFLGYGGSAFASALLGTSSSSGSETQRQAEVATPYLDRTRVRGRNQNRSSLACRHGVVCTSQPLASAAGYDVLKSGGNAIDAAVAANAMIGLVEPMSCGLGGDLFAIVWSQRDQKLFGLNASGRSPYNWDLKQAQALGLQEIPTLSPLSWSVPGCVSGWAALLERFGTRKPSELLAPTIATAREGFPVTPIIAGYWHLSRTAPGYDTVAKVFAPDGREPRYGDIFRNPRLANTLELLSKAGLGDFYHGGIAERIVKFSQKVGGKFTTRDFADHRANWVTPVSTSYRGYDVWELPPNGQGIATLQMLNILENFDIGSLKPNSPEQLHLFIEAKKLAFEDRAVYYADMDFADVPLKQLISKEYGQQRAKLIDPRRAAQHVKAGRLRSAADTIYMTTADDQGNMVSLIQSTYFGWGSHFAPDELGFCLQNRGNLFSLNPRDMNKLEPHKRPFHTIIPAFMTRAGQPVFSFGVMGGDFQPQGQTQVVMNTVDFHMSVQQAGDQPRAQHSESSTPTGFRSTGPGSVQLEQHIADSVLQRLTDMGHTVQRSKSAFGGYQGIWREEGPRRYFGGSDPRKDGCAMGY